MRRTALLLLALAAGTSLAAGFSQKDTPINTRYRETPEEAAAREFKEHTAKLPPLPDTHSDGWFDIYADENYGKQPKILLDSLQIMPAPDGSIRYILNIRSDKGYDNLTAEGIFCAASPSGSATANLPPIKCSATATRSTAAGYSPETPNGNR